MKHEAILGRAFVACQAMALCLCALPVEAQQDGQYKSLQQLRDELKAQTERLEQLRGTFAEQEAHLAELRRAIDDALLNEQRGGQTANAPAAPNAGTTQPARPVGQAPRAETRPPETAQIFSEPTVLTPSGKFALEPSLQNAYWSTDRVTLVGYTVIPAILVGLVDVRRVKTTTSVGSLAARVGIGNRFELEVRAPYQYINSETVSREIFTGTAQDKVFSARGSGLGDVDATARFQLNAGDYSKPFWIGWLRYKWSTGKDPFEVVTDCQTRCVANTTGTGLPLELSTGSGFNSAQVGLTWLFASDPAVFFGGFNYLYNFPRENVNRTLLSGEQENLGEIEPGAIYGFNFGMGLSLNEKSSFSVGYDQNLVDKTKQNGEVVPGSARSMLGTIILGVSYRYGAKTTLNLSVGAGVTRDTPDVNFTLRLPVVF